MKRTLTHSALDPAFGHEGLAVLPHDMTQATGMAMQDDNTLLIAGAAQKGSFMVARVLDTGHLDTRFGEQGVIRSEFEPGQSAVAVEVFAVPGDKTLVIYNTTMLNRPGITPVIARYHNDGRLDLSYGVDGTCPLHYPLDHQMKASSAAPSGQTTLTQNGEVLTSWWYPYYGKTVTYRIDQNGRLDPTFNQTGYAFLPSSLGSSAVWATVLLASGNTLLAGVFLNQTGGGIPFLVRYTTSGIPDPMFGDNGIVFLNRYAGGRYTHWLETPDNRIVGFGQNADKGSSLIALQGDGRTDPAFIAPPVSDVWQWTSGTYGRSKLTAVGHTANPHDLVIARHLADGALDPDFGDGTGWVRLDISMSDESDLPFTVQAACDALLVSGITTQGGISCGFVAKVRS